MGVMETSTGDHEQSFSRLVRFSGHGDSFVSVGDPNISFKYCSSVMVSAFQEVCGPYPLPWDCDLAVVG